MQQDDVIIKDFFEPIIPYIYEINIATNFIAFRFPHSFIVTDQAKLYFEEDAVLEFTNNQEYYVLSGNFNNHKVFNFLQSKLFDEVFNKGYGNGKVNEKLTIHTCAPTK